MKIAELTAYAAERYHIQEQHKWADFPGFSVLSDPDTGKWIALLMRQWDTDTGMVIERCDLKCGSDSLVRFERPYLSPPIRMKGNKWIGIAFDDRTDPDIIFQLFDKAIASSTHHGYTVVLASRLTTEESKYRDTALPFAGSAYRPTKENLPEQLREMKRLFEYGRESVEARAKNFYRQAVFMKDYEDDLPWTGSFMCYFPTYHDLTTRQLRGYFTWRTQLRRGIFQPIATSAAYIYLYELLNGVGADTPEDCLRKMKEFEVGYLDSGVGDPRMRANLRRWMLEYAVLYNLPQELARRAADPEVIEKDLALSVLQNPKERSHEEVFVALLAFGGKKLGDSPVLASDPEKGKRLFSEVWRAASSYQWQERDLFTLCFGDKRIRQWYPFSNAVYYEQARPKDRDYVLNGTRTYRCRNGVWHVEAYEKLSFDRTRFKGFLHETDARLRRYMKTGRYLRENPADEWALPYIDAVIEADKKALIEAARPKITIDLSGLAQIRKDAGVTRDSLLTEEEREDLEDSKEAAFTSTGEQAELPLEPVQLQILRALLSDRNASEIIRANRLMPSIIADSINEALFDVIGDTVLLCEDDRLILVDDYAEELEQYLGGITNG